LIIIEHLRIPGVRLGGQIALPIHMLVIGLPPLLE